MIPDSPDTPLFASWKERRTYALLQAAAIIDVFLMISKIAEDEPTFAPAEKAVARAEALLAEIESRLPESAE